MLYSTLAFSIQSFVNGALKQPSTLFLKALYPLCYELPTHYKWPYMSFLYAQKMHITIILRLGFFFAGKKDQMTQREV